MNTGRAVMDGSQQVEASGTVSGFALLTAWCGSARPVFIRCWLNFAPARSYLFTLKAELAAKRGGSSPRRVAQLCLHIVFYV